VRNIGTESGGKPALRQALELSARSAVAFARMSPGVPDGQAVVLEVAQLQALLATTFNVGLDVGRGKEPVALVRLRLAKALIGVAEANALAAESIATSAASGPRRSRRPRRWRCMRRRSTGCRTRCFT
jgi:hypothetical protein